MILAAHQPQYLPAARLIRKVAAADIFVVQDDVQFSKSEFQNRNRIRTESGTRWLTVPVRGSHPTPINGMVAAEPTWLGRHRNIVAQEYRDSVYLDRATAVFESLESVRTGDLATIALRALDVILEMLDIRTPIVLESEIAGALDSSTPDRRLQSLCDVLGADTYLSGHGGRAYMDLNAWEARGVAVEWADATTVEYDQLHPGFESNLSVVDLLLCVADPRSHLVDF